MKADPMRRQRSPWRHIESGQPGFFVAERRVHDGLLVAIVADEPLGWHLSISFRSHRGDLSRYPTWDELMHGRTNLLPTDVGFVMHLPAEDDYVAVHKTTFHLHQHPPKEG